jgi:hypothetical protein
MMQLPKPPPFANRRSRRRFATALGRSIEEAAEAEAVLVAATSPSRVRLKGLPGYSGKGSTPRSAAGTQRAM